jgi:hypothetical protein
VILAFDNVLGYILLIDGVVSNSKSMSQNAAVVTGSSSGIGYETSLILSRNGFQANDIFR